VYSVTTSQTDAMRPRMSETDWPTCEITWLTCGTRMATRQ
jgi:hypothetical protein